MNRSPEISRGLIFTNNFTLFVYLKLDLFFCTKVKQSCYFRLIFYPVVEKEEWQLQKKLDWVANLVLQRLFWCNKLFETFLCSTVHQLGHSQKTVVFCSLHRVTNLNPTLAIAIITWKVILCHLPYNLLIMHFIGHILILDQGPELI